MVARWTGLRIGLSIAVLLSAAACRQQPQEPATARAKVILATQAVPYSGLIAVADEKGYFAQAGLEVRIDLYPSGRDALGALMRGEAHVATVADIALAGAIIDDPTLRVIASIGTSTGSQVVARRDRSIATPADLKGKRVGYSPGTASHYYLHSFLLMNGIRRDDIAAVPVPPARQAQAVVSGEVDAVAAFDVYAFVAGRELGANAVAWDMQNTIDYQWLLATRADGALSPEAAARLLRALLRAEDFAVDHAEETRSILSRKWNYDPGFVRDSWARMRLFVSLNQSIITALQGYAQWQLSQGTQAGAVPDVLSTIETRPLEAADPRRVTVFR